MYSDYEADLLKAALTNEYSFAYLNVQKEDAVKALSAIWEKPLEEVADAVISTRIVLAKPVFEHMLEIYATNLQEGEVYYPEEKLLVLNKKVYINYFGLLVCWEIAKKYEVNQADDPRALQSWDQVNWLTRLHWNMQ